MIFLRSSLFNLAFYGWTAFLSVALAWTPLLPRAYMMAVARWYLRTVVFLERILLRLDYQVCGREHFPDGPCIIAAKHQSAWETTKLLLLVNDPAIVLKRELTQVPIWGSFARKAELIPVDRGAGARAVVGMLESARKAVAQGRPIVIFPQGTRTAPGVYHPYRIGVGVLYEQLRLPIVPMALNSGVFWPRRAFFKRPGRITIEFLPLIKPGLTRAEAMIQLETQLEAATDRLVMAVGGPVTPPAS